MSKRIVDLTCPECQKLIQVPFEVKEPPTLDEISNALRENLKKENLKGQLSTAEVERVIREQLEPLKPPKEDHRHKTADELLDCPECRFWVDKTIQRYQVTEKKEGPKKQTFEIGSLRAKETE